MPNHVCGPFVESKWNKRKIICRRCNKELKTADVIKLLDAGKVTLRNLRTLSHRDLEDGVHEQLADLLEGKVPK